MNMKKTPPPLPEYHPVPVIREFSELPLSKILQRIKEKCGCVSVEAFGLNSAIQDSDVLIFLPMASKEFKTMVYWGECHPINRDEQIYQGIGHIFKDGQRRIVIVSHFLYIYAAERTPVSACIMNGKMDSMMARIEYERDIYVKNEKKYNTKKDGTVYDPFIDLAGPSEPVLYGHTHPDLGCFFSAPDRTSGFATPNLPAVTFVADPIRMDMKAGVGIELRDAQILVYSYDKAVQSVKNKENKQLGNRKDDERASEAKPRIIRGVGTAKAEELISEISRDCNELLNPLYGAKGKFSSHTTITGAQKIKMEMTWKPEKNNAKQAANDIRVLGATYDAYA